MLFKYSGNVWLHNKEQIRVEFGNHDNYLLPHYYPLSLSFFSFFMNGNTKQAYIAFSRVHIP